MVVSAQPLKSILSLLSLALVLTGCDNVDRRPPATGAEGTVTVVIDNARWDGAVGKAIRDELELPVDTYPVSEPAFDLEQYDLSGQDLFERVIKRRKYVLIATTLDEESNVGRYVQSGLDSTTVASVEQEGAAILQRPNAWYRNQLVVYAIGDDSESLIKEIREKGDDIRYVFNQATRERLTEKMFRRMRQEDIEEQLMDEHDFAVNVQHDYFIAQDTLNFIRMRRVLSDTWREVFIYYIEDADPNIIETEWILDTRDSLTEKFVRGTFEGSYVKVDRRRPITSEPINFLGRYGYETRALWHMTQDAMGGPLLNYTFYDEDQQRVYMIDGMVFAPSYDKREFLRQVEAIAYTFRTRQVDAQTQEEEPVAALVD